MDDDMDWTMISFEKPEKPAVMKIAAGSQADRDRAFTKMVEHVRNRDIVAAAKSCPKCGRGLGKGGHFHVKHCQGDK